MLTLKEAYEQKEALNERIQALQNDLEDMCENPAEWWDLEGQYNDMLNDCNECVVINGMEYLPSQVLAEVDPTAYRCGFNDYCSDFGENQARFMLEYEERESEIEDLESDLEELEGGFIYYTETMAFYAANQ